MILFLLSFHLNFLSACEKKKKKNSAKLEYTAYLQSRSI